MTCYEHMRKNIRFLTHSQILRESQNHHQLCIPSQKVRKWYERIYSKKKSFHKQTHQSSPQNRAASPAVFFVLMICELPSMLYIPVTP